MSGSRARRVWLASLLLSVLTAGCALTPDYQRPDLGVPDEWLRTEAGRANVANTPWWELYGDPVLRGLIERALERNQDLALALARLQESRDRRECFRQCARRPASPLRMRRGGGWRRRRPWARAPR